MSPAEVLRVLLAMAIGFLLGSVLPADLLARHHDVDIRDVGDGNPGTVNAFRGLGMADGVITLAYDASVGVAAIVVARLLGVSQGAAYLAGLMTIIGHRFPVLRRFRDGGQGMAASAGLLVYGIAVALSQGWLSLVDLVVLVAVGVVALLVTRSDRAIPLVLLPILLMRLAAAGAGWQYLAFMIAVAANMWLVQLNQMRHGVDSAMNPMSGHARR